MTTCPNGHGNPDGQRFCGECGAPLAAAPPAELLAQAARAEAEVSKAEAHPRALHATRIGSGGQQDASGGRELRRGDRVKVVAPGDDHDGRVGVIDELLDDDSEVCVKFSGDSEPYAFGRDEVKVLPTARNKPASKPTGSNASESQQPVAKRSTPNPARRPPSPGWYPDPLNPGKQAYWDGTGWGEPVGVPSDFDTGKKTAVAVGVCVLVVIGFVMSLQTVSLLTGSGLVWTGVAVVAAGTAVAFFLRAATWVRVIAALFLVFALFNALYIENQMSNKRNEITQIFDN